jgi:CTP:molybdopterin cytidylyltransferase MocA
LTVAGVVLAAGGGSRFLAGGGNAVATHKLLAPFRGRPLMAWALQAVKEAGFNQIYVVSGAVDVAPVVADVFGCPNSDSDQNSDSPGGSRGEPEAPVSIIHNRSWAEGQATSLTMAAEAAAADGHRAMVVGLADQPFVPASAWRSVGAAAGEIVTATFGGQRRPPVKFERSVWVDLPRSGDEGARSLFKLRPELVSELPCNGNPIDIDTVEDLQRWS